VSDYDPRLMLDRGLEVSVPQATGGEERGAYFIG
jgi:hypothetical protein